MEDEHELRQLTMTNSSTPDRLDDGQITPDRSSVVFPDPGIPPEEIAERLRSIRVKFRSREEHMPAPEYPEDGQAESSTRDEMPDLEKGDTAQSDANDGEGKNHLTRAPTIRDRARHWLAKLGRAEEPGDGLTPADITAHWIEDLPPLADGQHEEPRIHEHLRRHAHRDAHRSLRGIGFHHNLRRRKRPQHNRTLSSDSTVSFAAASDTETEGLHPGEGVLSHLLRLQAQSSHSGYSTPGTPGTPDSGTTTPKSGATTPKSPPRSGTVTPKKVKWYSKHSPNQSTLSLVGAGLHLGTQGAPVAMDDMKKSVATKRRRMMGGKKEKREYNDHIAARIASIITRQRYLMTLCRAMMRFGAPSHRLEEYMSLTAQALDIHAQFLYLPDTMIMSFDDLATRTTEVKLVRVAQGVDLARLEDTQNIYKNLVHDKITADEAIEQLDSVINRPPKYPTWLVVICYGLASVSVGPFAFEARPIDMPITFFLGCLLGVLKLVFSPRSSLYSNVFEVLATILSSFLARAFGSIPKGVSASGDTEYYFCFSAMTQSSIALILPGFLVLSSSLELQSHQIIPGSIRMVYAIIYSLFLGYGITVGTTIYGLMDGDANSNTSCSGQLIGNNPYSQRFPFVAIYVVFLIVINQGKWKQGPIMILIAEAGYIVNYFSNLKLASNPELANTLSAFVIGVLGNLYSRLWHGHAATAILPAIFVLVPSGLASQGSLVSGVQSASEIRASLAGSSNSTTTTSSSDSSVYSMGYGMIQVAIGITVGLFLAAVVIYPFGKRRTGLFSF